MPGWLGKGGRFCRRWLTTTDRAVQRPEKGRRREGGGGGNMRTTARGPMWERTCGRLGICFAHATRREGRSSLLLRTVEERNERKGHRMPFSPPSFRPPFEKKKNKTGRTQKMGEEGKGGEKARTRQQGAEKHKRTPTQGENKTEKKRENADFLCFCALLWLFLLLSSYIQSVESN